MTLGERVAATLRDVPDFPQPGVLFKDVTPVLADGSLLREVVDDVARRRRGQVDVVLGMEARGFVVGSAVAYALGLGFVPVRKAGKLPGRTTTVEYALEYGMATLEIHVDALHEGQRVLVVDDVLATGGTARATCELVERAGAVVVALEMLVEVTALGGREALGDREVVALVSC